MHDQQKHPSEPGLFRGWVRVRGSYFCVNCKSKRLILQAHEKRRQSCFYNLSGVKNVTQHLSKYCWKKSYCWWNNGFWTSPAQLTEPRKESLVSLQLLYAEGTWPYEWTTGFIVLSSSVNSPLVNYKSQNKQIKLKTHNSCPCLIQTSGPTIGPG